MSQAVAVFRSDEVVGDVLFSETSRGVTVHARFSKVPEGEHGFHIHRAGDLRGEGCSGACDHYHRGRPSQHGGPPSANSGPRHTGDLGNISGPSFEKHYSLTGLGISDLWGRSLIVHADQDDYGKGEFDDSLITGHAGKRIACAIIGRVNCTTRKKRKTMRLLR